MKNFLRNSVFMTFLLLSFQVSMAATNYYLAPQGDDAAAGTRRAPWRTLERAQRAVRESRQNRPTDPVTVSLFGGTYTLSAPLVLEAADGGTATAPVTFQAVEGQTPILTGGVSLTGWTPLSHTRPELAASTQGQIYTCDLRALGITNFGDPTQLGAHPDLYDNDLLQTLARWPNRGFTHADKALGRTPAPENWAHFVGAMEGVFSYTDDRTARWAAESDARLSGYWFWDWSEEFQRLERIDTATRTIYLHQPYHTYGYKDSLRYFGLNLLCELDTPGEWYLDRSSGQLYWWPVQAPTSRSRISFTLFEAPYMIELRGCNNVTLRGITLQEGRGSAIRIQGGADCLISECRIQRFGRDAILVEQGTHHGVSACHIRDMGCSGVKLLGGDRKNLTPADHYLEQTLIENFSRFKRTYEPAAFMDGCGIRVSHNTFRNSSSSALRVGGNDMLIEYNWIDKVVDESDDQGGTDIYYDPSYRGIVIRNNRWSNIQGGTHCGAAGVRLDDMISGVEITGNVFDRCGTILFGGVQINGGKDNLVDNNLFYNCQAAVSFSIWSAARWFEHLDGPRIRKQIYEDVDISSALYLSRYPALKQIRENINVNTVSNNLLVDCQRLTQHNSNEPENKENKAQIWINNTLIPSDGAPLESFCREQTLSRYGLSPIALDQMGVQQNPYLTR